MTTDAELKASAYRFTPMEAGYIAEGWYLSEWLADRRLTRALVEALPKCHCGAVALWLEPGTPDMDTGRRDEPAAQCDTHKGNGCGRRGCCDPDEVAYAPEARAASARIAQWDGGGGGR
jgi:hypothetical protein